MIHLNPIQYPKLIRRTIFIVNISGKEIIFKFTKEQARIYYGKLLCIIVNNTTIFGRYHVRETINGIEHFILSETNLSSSVSMLIGNEVEVLETFKVTDDTQATTYQDVRERLDSEQQDAVFDINKISDYGIPGLLSGIESVKVKSLTYDYKFPSEINVTSYFNPVVNVKLNRNRPNYFKLFLYNKLSGSIEGNLICLEFCIDGNGDYYYVKNYSHFSQSSNLSRDILLYTDPERINNYELKLTRTLYQDGSANFVINLRLVNNDSEFLTGYFACNLPQDLWGNNATIASQNNVMKLNGQDSIVLNSSLLFADTYGEQKTFTLGDTPTKAIPLGKKDGASATDPARNVYISSLPVGFYRINSSGCTIDGPCNTNDDSLNIEINGKNVNGGITKADWNSADLIVFNNTQAMYITDNGETFIGKKTGTNKYEWHRLSVWGHQHSSLDVDDSDNDLKKFVTQEQIDNWNKALDELDKISWINYNPTNSLIESENVNKYENRVGSTKLFVNQVGTGNGLKEYAGNAMIYANLGNGQQYVPLTIGALKVENAKVKNPWETGCLIKQSTINELGKLGIGIRIPETTVAQYPNQTYRQQYVLIDNQVSYYQHTANQTVRFFDLVKRNNVVTVGTNSVNIGFLNSVAKQESILYGTGILNEFTNQIIIGHWNAKTTKDIKFVVGTGDNDSNRRNAFWYREVLANGETQNYFHINGLVNLEGFEPGMILVNGENPVINDFAHMADIDRLQAQIDKMLIEEYNIIGYEELYSEEKGYQYVRNKPVDYLPLKVIINGIGTVLDEKTYAVFITEEFDKKFESNENKQIMTCAEVVNGVGRAKYFYVEALSGNYLIVWNKKTNTGKKFELIKFYDTNNATFIIEIDYTKTGTGITNVTNADAILPLEYSF